jgi:hypothetical protein
VTGVQTCALPISADGFDSVHGDEASGQLDLTREELAAFADRTTGLTSFMALTFGRTDSEKSLVIGDPNGAPLKLGIIPFSLRNG